VIHMLSPVSQGITKRIISPLMWMGRSMEGGTSKKRFKTSLFRRDLQKLYKILNECICVIHAIVLTLLGTIVTSS
jgi:hypothetical protein